MPKLSELTFKNENARGNFFAFIANNWPKNLDPVVSYEKRYTRFNHEVEFSRGMFNYIKAVFSLPQEEELYNKFLAYGKEFGGNKTSRHVGCSYVNENVKIIHDLEIGTVLWVLGREKKWVPLDEIKDQLPEWFTSAENALARLEPMQCL